MSENHKKPSRLMALIWAAALLLATWIARDSGQSDKIFFIMLVGSAIVFATMARTSNCERKLWRRLTGRGTE